MPFFEVFDFGATPAVRKSAAELVTKSLCDAFDVPLETVSIYFFAIESMAYSHAGKFGHNVEIKRVFIKLHAFGRSEALRRTAAQSLTQAFATAYGVPPKAIVIYFFDRAPDEVSHAGVLASA